MALTINNQVPDNFLDNVNNYTIYIYERKDNKTDNNKLTYT